MRFTGFKFGVGTILVLLGLTVCGGCKKKEEAARRGPPPTLMVDVVAIKPRPFQATLFATGTLRARESVTLQAERSGAVTAISFEEGAPVKAGDVLVAINDSELQAQLSSAKAQLELAMANEKRDRDLLGTNMLISEAAYEQTRANLHVAEADLRLIEAQMKKTRITAPFDGVTGLRQVSLGAYLTPGTPIGSFQDISTLKLDFTVPERYLLNLRNAKTVNVRVAGVNHSIVGEIYAIEPVIDTTTRSLQVRALIPNQEQRLFPGAFAEVEIVLEEIPDAILIPAIALIPGLKQQKVFLRVNGQVEEREVETGLRTADGVQIVKGLEPGDELIISGILQLRPGNKVQIRPPQNAPVVPATNHVTRA